MLAKVMNVRIASAAVLLFFFTFAAAHAQSEERLHALAAEAAGSGQIDAAFMHFRSLLTEYPHSKYEERALFAMGEYYFRAADYRDAAQMLTSLLEGYPDSEGRLFALAYLLKIAERAGEEALAQKLKNEIVTLRQHSFLFRNFKEYKYLSPLSRKYRALYYIDKIEFYVDGELFAQISY